MKRSIKEENEGKDINGQIDYHALYAAVADMLEYARHTVARTANAIMTATYWEIGRRIVEFEQEGKTRAGYGKGLIERLAADLCEHFGRGFSRQNLQQMRQFYLLYSPQEICQTLSGEFMPSTQEPICPTVSDVLQMPSAKYALSEIAACFPLPCPATPPQDFPLSAGMVYYALAARGVIALVCGK